MRTRAKRIKIVRSRPRNALDIVSQLLLLFDFDADVDLRAQFLQGVLGAIAHALRQPRISDVSIDTDLRLETLFSIARGPSLRRAHARDTPGGTTDQTCNKCVAIPPGGGTISGRRANGHVRHPSGT